MSQMLKITPIQVKGHKTVVFSEGQRIDNDLNINQLVIQVKDFVVRARLDNSLLSPLNFSSLGSVSG